VTNKLSEVLTLAAIGVSIVATVYGQDARVVSAAGDKYVISAKAGGVNYTEGRVVVARREGNGGQLLKGDEVQIGDRVATGADGRAEILLNPGSYMRVDKETEFSFVSTSLDDLKIRLNSGSAIFEVIADDDFKVTVRSPKSRIELIRSGVYRIDVAADGSGKISVWKGTAFVGSAKTEVKAGRAATVNGESAAVAKFDRDQKDGLDTWSKERAKELTKVNASLQRKVLRNSLLNSFNHRAWNMYDSFGLWIFDPGRSFWCFMPFGYGWGSPYGFGYGYDFWTIGMPSWIYYQPAPPWSGTPPTSGPPTAGGGTTKTPRLPNNGDTHGRLGMPPYMKIENNERGSGDVVVNRRIELPRNRDMSLPMPTGGGVPAASAPISTPTISLPNRGTDGGTPRVKQP
jgi:hypothetical protein